MDPETKEYLEAINQKIEAIWISVEKTRKYFLWTMIVTLVTFILPLVALIFVIPYFIRTITTGLNI